MHFCGKQCTGFKFAVKMFLLKKYNHPLVDFNVQWKIFAAVYEKIECFVLDLPGLLDLIEILTPPA